MGKTVHPLFVDLFKEPKLQKLRFCDAYSNFGESAGGLSHICDLILQKTSDAPKHELKDRCHSVGLNAGEFASIARQTVAILHPSQAVLSQVYAHCEGIVSAGEAIFQCKAATASSPSVKDTRASEQPTNFRFYCTYNAISSLYSQLSALSSRSTQLERLLDRFSIEALVSALHALGDAAQVDNSPAPSHIATMNAISLACSSLSKMSSAVEARCKAGIDMLWLYCTSRTNLQGPVDFSDNLGREADSLETSALSVIECVATHMLRLRRANTRTPADMQNLLSSLAAHFSKTLAIVREYAQHLQPHAESNQTFAAIQADSETEAVSALRIQQFRPASKIAQTPYAAAIQSNTASLRIIPTENEKEMTGADNPFFEDIFKQVGHMITNSTSADDTEPRKQVRPSFGRRLSISSESRSRPRVASDASEDSVHIKPLDREDSFQTTTDLDKLAANIPSLSRESYAAALHSLQLYGSGPSLPIPSPLLSPQAEREKKPPTSFPSPSPVVTVPPTPLSPETITAVEHGPENEEPFWQDFFANVAMETIPENKESVDPAAAPPRRKVSPHPKASRPKSTMERHVEDETSSKTRPVSSYHPSPYAQALNSIRLKNSVKDRQGTTLAKEQRKSENFWNSFFADEKSSNPPNDVEAAQPAGQLPDLFNGAYTSADGTSDPTFKSFGKGKDDFFDDFFDNLDDLK